MITSLFKESSEYTPIISIMQSEYDHWRSQLSDTQKAWLNTMNSKYEPGNLSIIPGKTGQIDHVAWFCDPEQDFWQAASLMAKLPLGAYRFEKIDPEKINLFCLAWGLGAYTFDSHKTKKSERSYPRLVWPEGCDVSWVLAALKANRLARDLINEPANSLTPLALAEKAGEKLEDIKAQAEVVADWRVEKKYLNMDSRLMRHMMPIFLPGMEIGEVKSVYGQMVEVFI
jgi:leucyl aminopeptidase